MTSRSVFRNYRWSLFSTLHMPSTHNCIIWVLFSPIYSRRKLQRLNPVSHRPWLLESNSGPCIQQHQHLDNQVPDSHKGPCAQFKSAQFTGLSPANNWWQTHVLAQSCRYWLKSSGESWLECKHKGIQNCVKDGWVF